MYSIYKLLLLKAGVTTADVCRATGISQSTMSNWKRRQNLISSTNAKKIAEFFGVSVDYLMYGKEPDSADSETPAEQIITDKKGRFSIHFRDGKNISEADKEQLADFIQLSIEQYYKLKGIE